MSNGDVQFVGGDGQQQEGFGESEVTFEQGETTTPSTGFGESTVTFEQASDASGVSGASGVAGASGATGTGFCGTEERVSTHTCNSLHPSVDIDPNGNIAVAWHDTRDGTFEIYFRTLASKLDRTEAAEALAAQKNSLSRTINLDCAFPEPDPQKGKDDLQAYSAALRCEETPTNSGLLIRSSNGRLDVNPTSRTMVLSVQDQGVNFIQAGVKAGSLLRIENGANANLQVTVLSVVGPNVLNVAYVDGASTDSGFTFAVEENPTVSLTTCETRLTCSEFTSVFPSVVSDHDGRFHVVYHSDDTGKNQLYYIQLAPQNVGIKDDCRENPPINVQGGFAEVPVGTPGSVAFTEASGGSVSQKAFKATGSTGDFFSYGNRFLVPAQPNRSIFQQDRTGLHKLFRDFAQGNGSWTGVSLAEDRDAWDAQMSGMGQSVTPDVVFGEHPVAGEGDFGTRFDFGNVAFMAQTPPDASVAVRIVALPISPRYTPRGGAFVVELREQDLVMAPKRPVPPSFEDPVDISQILNSPNVQEDGSLPGRFTIEGDAGGTVFTNIIQRDARGQFSRLVFRKDTEQDDVKFILGQQQCGDYPCGVKVAANALEADPRTQYGMTLQVWKGSDYRLDTSQVVSAQMSAVKIFEKEFLFDQSEELSAFVFKDGELILPSGSIVFFVPISSENTEFTVEGVGGGNVLWSTDGSGMMENYSSVPFTLKPYSGLNVPVYYDGVLIQGTGGSSYTPGTGSVVIDTNIATSVIPFAFGAIWNGAENRAYAVAQGFNLAEDSTLSSISIGVVAGTSSQEEDGSVGIADPARTLVIEIYGSSGEASPVPYGEALASAEIVASDIHQFDDSVSIPTVSDMETLTVGFDDQDIRLAGGTYFVVFREGGQNDAGGRFWTIADISGNFVVGKAYWNGTRPIDAQGWNTLTGQLQISMRFFR